MFFLRIHIYMMEESVGIAVGSYSLDFFLSRKNICVSLRW